MNNVIYREAVAPDAPAIVEFQILMARETEEIELDGTVVASLMITHEWSDWRNGDVWWIQSVYVIAAARVTGLNNC